jgi:hypothetical protein
MRFPAKSKGEVQQAAGFVVQTNRSYIDELHDALGIYVLTALSMESFEFHAQALHRQAHDVGN